MNAASSSFHEYGKTEPGEEEEEDDEDEEEEEED